MLLRMGVPKKVLDVEPANQRHFMGVTGFDRQKQGNGEVEP